MITNIDLLEPLQGKDVGMILGLPHEGVALAGECNDANKVFTYDEKYAPLFDADFSGPPVDENDVTVYNTGVEVTVTAIDTDKREITLETAPSDGSVMTADLVQELEPYIAQAVSVDVDYDEDTYGRLRSPVKKKIYGAREVTITVDLLFADLVFLNLFFDDNGRMLGTPPRVHGYIPLDEDEEEVGRIYFNSCRMVPGTFLDVSEGDTASYSLELSVDTDPIIWSTALQRRPVANFTGAPTSGTEPLEVTFTNLSTGDELDFLWDFGDGSEDSDDENPVHTYESHGDYTVTLKAYNDAGEDIITRMNYIIVEED